MLTAVLWLIASEALSRHVSRNAGFGVTYDALGAAVRIMLRFYLWAYAALLGAELNAGLEGFRKRGSQFAQPKLSVEAA